MVNNRKEVVKEAKISERKTKVMMVSRLHFGLTPVSIDKRMANWQG